MHQIPSSYFTFSRCNWNWRKWKFKKRRLSSSSQGCCCTELSVHQAPSLSHHAVENGSWGHSAPAQSTGTGLSPCLISSPWLTERSFLSCLLLFCPPLLIAPLVLLVLTKPKARGRSCWKNYSFPSIVWESLYTRTYFKVFDDVKTYMKVIPLLQHDWVQNYQLKLWTGRKE